MLSYLLPSPTPPTHPPTHTPTHCACGCGRSQNENNWYEENNSEFRYAILKCNEGEDNNTNHHSCNVLYQDDIKVIANDVNDNASHETFLPTMTHLPKHLQQRDWIIARYWRSCLFVCFSFYLWVSGNFFFFLPSFPFIDS